MKSADGIALVPDTDVEHAFHRLVNAALDQKSPSRRLRKHLNALLTLIGHPLRDQQDKNARLAELEKKRRVNANIAAGKDPFADTLEVYREAVDNPEEDVA